MTAHDLWHVLVLGVTLMVAAGVVILALAPLAFEEMPPGLKRARPVIIWLAVGAVALLAVEWLGVH